MCKILLVSLRVRAEAIDGGPYPGLPEPVEVDSHPSGADGTPCCLCCLSDHGPDGEGARAAVMAALKPFLTHVLYGNILIEVI